MSRTLPRALHRRPQHGFALITALLFLLVVLLLGIGMLRSSTVQEKIAGNTRDKQRAFQAAQSALQYGEWWLKQGNAGTGKSCTAVVNANVVANMMACSNPLSAPMAPTQWTAYATYTPPNMVVKAGGGAVLNGNGDPDINYTQAPKLYVYYMGLSPDGNSMLYQVTAAGYGGNAATIAVLQSVYAIKSKNTDLGSP